MKLPLFFTRLMTILFIVTSSVTLAVEENVHVKVEDNNVKKKEVLTAIEYLQLMQKSYKELNYELIYLNDLQNKL